MIDQFLQILDEEGVNVVQLNKYNAVNEKGQPCAKVPLESIKHCKKPTKEAHFHIKTKHNYAFKLNKNVVVFDVDDEEKYKQFISSWGVLPKTLTVKSPNGYHYYFKTNKNLRKLKNGDIDGYKGLEFKTGERVTVTGPKSKNHKGVEYTIEHCPPTGLATLPEKIHKHYQVSEAVIDCRERSQSIKCLELEDLLKGLDPLGYRGYTAWFKLMCSCHHATKGEGLKEWLDWCERDEYYKGERNLIEQQWLALNDEKEVIITGERLFRELLQAGFPRIDLVGKAKTLLDSRTKEIYKEIEKKRAEEHISISANEIKEWYKKALLISDDTYNIVKIDVADLIKRSGTKITQSAIKGLENMARKETKIDSVNLQLAEGVLKAHFCGGEGLVLSEKTGLYRYNKLYWAPTDPEFVRGLIFDYLRQKDPTNPRLDKHTGEIEKYIIPMVSGVKIEAFTNPQSVDRICCQNGEISIKDEYKTLKTPEPKSYVLNCLGVDFVKDAKCPEFIAFTENIFRHESQKHLSYRVKYMQEMMGYCLQPNKSIESFFVWYGTGGNGKSVFLRVLQRLCGNSIGSFEAGKLGKDVHGLASLEDKTCVVDEDFDYHHKLPSDVIKKLSENSLLYIRKMHQVGFAKKNTATPVILTNGLPEYSDTSSGVARRLHIIDFPNTFEPNAREKQKIDEMVDKEISGIL